MIILDTNIISELMKSLPSQSLLRWMEQQSSQQMYVTSISIGEIMYGLCALPLGQRRTTLERTMKQVIEEAFSGRCFFFDDAAAIHYGKLMGMCKEKGLPMSVCDAQIAAIALLHDAQLATRNTKDFQTCGVSLINPFEVDAPT